jgi:hypothetical protein
MNARSRNISLCLGRNLGCFRNDQAGAGALSVVQGVQGLRRVPFPSPAPRERRHENAVLERTSAEFDCVKAGLAVKLSRQTKRSETERVGLLIGRKTDEKVNFICRVLSRARDVY